MVMTYESTKVRKKTFPRECHILACMLVVQECLIKRQ